MSINQAAIHYNLPYSSLYGRFKRGKYDTGNGSEIHSDHSPDNSVINKNNNIEMTKRY